MITLQTIIDALRHCGNDQERDLVRLLNEGSDLSAGPVLAEIVAEYMEEDEEEIEPDLDNPSIDAIHSDRLGGIAND